MTTKAAFSPEEWNVVLEGPSTAGMIVVTAAHGGMFRETVAIAKDRGSEAQDGPYEVPLSRRAQGSRARAHPGRGGAARKQGDHRGT